jgi:hypothetical protein
VFAAAASLYSLGMLIAALTGIPSALDVSVVIVAATTWAFGSRWGVAVVAVDLSLGVLLFATGALKADVPAGVELIPGALTDVFVWVAVAALRQAEFRRAATEAELREKNAELETTLAEVKELRGMLPICAWCKCIRDVSGMWSKLETYLAKHSHATFTHGICPKCLENLEKQTQSLPPAEA